MTNLTTKPSTFEDPEWPPNALPQRWIEALFSRMQAFYGERFGAMWRGSDVGQVQRAWAIELGKLSRDQLKAGSDNLTAISRPPTLPEFVEHCLRMRRDAVAMQRPKLTDQRRSSPEVVGESMSRIRSILGPLAAQKVLS